MYIDNGIDKSSKTSKSNTSQHYGVGSTGSWLPELQTRKQEFVHIICESKVAETLKTCGELYETIGQRMHGGVTLQSTGS